MKKFLKNLTNSYKVLTGSMQVKSSGFSTLNEVLIQLQTAYGAGNSRGIGWLTALGSIQYYNTVAPIANGVDKIAQQCADISLSIWDKKNKVWIKDGDVQGTPQKMFDLLKKTDYNQPYSTFIKAQISYRLITGNNFTIVVSSGISGEPIEVITAKPQNIVVIGSGTSYAQMYRWVDGNRMMDFTLDLATMRYSGFDKLGNKWEIMHGKDFNPLLNTSNLWGRSRLTPVYNEMEGYVEGIIQNKNLMKKGARPSGVLTLDEEMGDAQYEKARAEAINFYSGAESAGSILIFEGEGAKFENFNISPRDMDFAKLYDRIERTLYNRLNIPAPLYKDSAMTYNNLDNALYQLYILATNPILSEFLLELDVLFDDKYKDATNYTFGIDPTDVEALKGKQIDVNTKIAGNAVITVDENRQLFGFQERENKEEGNKLLFPTGKAGQDTVEETVPQQEKPQKDNGDTLQDEEKGKKKKKTPPKKGETKSLGDNIIQLARLLKQQGEQEDKIIETVADMYGRN